MAISLIDPKQIRNFTSPTGVWTPSGWTISGAITISSGLVSGTTGNFNDFSVETLDVNGAIRSEYLSGVIGNTVTGSGVIEFNSIPDVSGNNIHYRHVVHNGSRSSVLQSFSSADSQNGWFYYVNNDWSAFPAIGLDGTTQRSTLVRHIFVPTGLTTNSNYFSEIQPIYAGSITGDYLNSVQFKAANGGFSVLHPQFPYTFALPQITGLGAGSGGAVTGAYVQLVGQGQVTTQVSGNNKIIISGSGVNSIALTGLPQRQGNIIFSASGGVTFSETQTSSGTMFTFYAPTGTSSAGGGGVGNVTGIGVANPLYTGGFLFSGTDGITAEISSISTNLSGINFGLNFNVVTGFGLGSGSPLFSSGFSLIGASGVGVGLINLGNGVSGFAITGYPYAVTGIGIYNSSPSFLCGAVSFLATGSANLTYSGNNIVIGATPTVNNYTTNYYVSGGGVSSAGLSGVQFTGNMGLSGAGSVSISLITGQDTYGFDGLFIVSGSSQSVGGIGNVTGLGLLSQLYTGGFAFIGQNGVTVSLSGISDGVSGIVFSGPVIPPLGVTGFSVNQNTPLYTGGLVITGTNGVTASLVNLGSNTSGILISATSTLGGVTGFAPDLSAPLHTGGLIITGVNGISTYWTDIGGTSGIAVSGASTTTVVLGSGATDVSLSFFIPSPATGNAILEGIYPTDWVCTGYTIALGTTGSGNPISGSFYQRDAANNTSTISDFTLNQNTVQTSVAGLSVLVSGRNRVGFNLTNLVSPVANMTLGVFGSGDIASPTPPSPISFSFFFDTLITGNNILEAVSASSWNFTGYSLRTISLGTGITPMSGSIYQRDFSNNKYTLASFTFESGLYFKQSGGFYTNVTGQHTIGVDITSALSGTANMTLGVFGV